jgi:6-phosphogluconolactonase/glucosamine-6-phosphate isomerase/deaminase
MSKLTILFVGLDEWVGMNHLDEGSCGNSVFREFIIPLNIKPENRHFFDGRATDLKAECQKMDEIITSRGGLDVMLVGIGQNGHIGLNEPGYSWKLKAHVSDLAEITKTVGQKYFSSETTLTQGITLGLSYFSEAKLPILIANGEKKASIIQQIIMEEASEDRPASILQVIPQAVTIVDRAAAAGLG